MDIYVVKKGDTLGNIAANFGVSAGLLAAANGIEADETLVVGQTLVVRYPEKLHTVVPGDTVYSVARQYGISVTELFQRNYVLGGQNRLYRDQTLVISYADEPEKTIGVNGYAYPFINMNLLDATLPYMTYLAPFTYGIDSEGHLLPLSDGELLAAAGYYRTATLMHLSSLTEEGRFSNDRSSKVLRDARVRQKLIGDVVETLQKKNFFGLDVDFEYVFPEERELYADFVRTLRDTLNPLGYPVVVALAPKTNAMQRGLLYEAHDYAALGAAANAVLLMTYEWGYTYGPPMAVAPLPQVRQVLTYALSEITAEKIFLGVPLYGYDWALPYEEGASRAESISMEQAVALARRYGEEIRFDETAQSPYFRYTDRGGRQHEVWFEDARSMRAKLSLVEEFSLQGVGYWNLMRPFAQNWALLTGVFRVEKLF